MSDEVLEGLSGFISAATGCVGESGQSERGFSGILKDVEVFNEPSRALGSVVASSESEGRGSSGAAALSIEDVEVESEGAVEVLKGSELKVTVAELGDGATGGDEVINGEFVSEIGIGGGVDVGVTDKEVGGLDGVDGVFHAVGEDLLGCG